MRLLGLSTHDVATSVCLLLSTTFFSLTSASSVTREPVSVVHTIRNATIHTATNRIHALSHFDLSFVINTVDSVKLRLEPNNDIFPEGAVVSHADEDGRIYRQEPLDRMAHKIYKGNAWTRSSESSAWIPAGWARVAVMEDGPEPLFDGSFSVDRDTHYIHLTRNYLQTRHAGDPEVNEAVHGRMVLHRDSDVRSLKNFGRKEGTLRRSVELGLVGEQPACMADELDFNTMPDHPVHQEILRRSEHQWGSMSVGSLFGKRDVDSTPSGGNSAGVNLVSTIGQTAGCPTTRKVALVGVLADCNYRAAFSSDNDTRTNIISQMNQASSIWERSLNISLGLQNVTILPETCPGSPQASTPFNRNCDTPDFDITARLNAFSQWRGTVQDSNSHWTLLSTCNTGSAVGLAWLGQACINQVQTSNSSVTGNGQSSDGTQSVSGANVVIRTQGANEWQIIAHETGHTFGAVHDCTSDTCASANTVSSSQCCPLSSSTCDAGEKYMMNPSTSEGITDFSPCSIGNICSALGRNSVRSTCLSDNKGVPTITGQQCGNGIVENGEDCDPGGTDDACCDAKTCKFKSGAVCDDSNEDCCHGCQFASAGTVCRPSTGVCDPQETCSGSSPTCPADVTAPNGQGCGSGLTCASGQCTSRDQQCKTVMGSYTSNNDTSSCDSSGCQISCASPEFGRGVCYGLQQNFLDGTICAGNGKCSNGKCTGSSIAGQVKSWIDSNKPVVIGVSVSLGLFVLFLFLTCVFRCFRRRRSGRKGAAFPPAAPPPGGWRGWNGPPPPQQGGYGGQQVPAMSGGNGDLAPPQPAARRGQSVRYA